MFPHNKVALRQSRCNFSKIKGIRLQKISHQIRNDFPYIKIFAQV